MNYELRRYQHGDYRRGDVLAKEVFELGGYDVGEWVKEGWLVPTEKPLTHAVPVAKATSLPASDPLADVRKLRERAAGLEVDLDIARKSEADLRAALAKREEMILGQAAEIDGLKQALVERNTKVEGLEKEKAEWFARLEEETKPKGKKQPAA